MPDFFKQKVNQWLCISLLVVMCGWTVMYYTISKAVGAVDTYEAQVSNYSIPTSL